MLLEEAAAAEASTMFKDKLDVACSDGYIQLDTKQPYLEGLLGSPLQKILSINWGFRCALLKALPKPLSSVLYIMEVLVFM